MHIAKIKLFNHDCEVFQDKNDNIIRVFVNTSDIEGYGRMYEWDEVPSEIQNLIETELMRRP